MGKIFFVSEFLLSHIVLLYSENMININLVLYQRKQKHSDNIKNIGI
jgi:hypothetical protein